MKSINDFIQTIICSVIEDNPFNWLICEGSSEKLYFDYYFKDEIIQNRLRIVPVGGAIEVKRIYEHLAVSIDEFKSQIRGKIIFISDTDSQLVCYDTKNISGLMIKRLVNYQNDTKLVPIDGNPKSPKTEIEDCLNGRLFNKTLFSYKEDNFDLLDFVENEEKPEIPSYFAMDLNLSNSSKLTNFFDNNNMKFEFAKRYIEFHKMEEYNIPNWINEIKSFITS